MMEIVFSSAGQLAAAIRAGHVSAVEVLEAHLAQIDRHNPTMLSARRAVPAAALQRRWRLA